MTSHEFEAHLDATIEEMDCEKWKNKDEAEHREAYDAKLRKEGALDALYKAINFLYLAGINSRFPASDIPGLRFAIHSLKDDVAKLQETPLSPEVGGDFPDGYFDTMVAEGGVCYA